jgi:hypothetical protein
MPKTAPTPAERALWGRKGGHTSWGNTTDRTARTAPARAALEQRFIDQAGGDAQRAANIRAAYYADLALRSAQARRRKSKTVRPGTDTGDAA